MKRSIYLAAILLPFSAQSYATDSCVNDFLQSQVGISEYKVTYNAFSGSGQLSLQKVEQGGYLFQQKLNMLLAKLDVESELVMKDDQISSLHYRENLSGLAKKLIEIDFNDGKAAVTRKGVESSYVYQGVVQDQLSQTLAIQAKVACNTDLGEIEMQLASPKRLKQVTYVRGEDLNLSKRMGGVVAQQWLYKDGETTDRVVLVPEWNYKIAVIEHAYKDDITRLELKQAPGSE